MSDDLERQQEELLQTYSGVFGDPVTHLIESFRVLYPDVLVQVAYASGVENWLPRQSVAQALSEVEGVFETALEEEEEVLDLEDDQDFDEDRDWTTGAMIALVKRDDTTVIVLDWESTPAESVAVLLELLPRLVSNPYQGEQMQSQFSYRVARRRLSELYESVMSNYFKTVLPVVMSKPDMMSVVHASYEEIYGIEDDELEIEILEIEDGDDDDDLAGGF